MAQILSFRDLDAWQLAMELVLETYAVVRLLPASEQFELSRQMRRAAVSIPSNVAEGHAGGKDRRYLHHVRIALGSLAELDTQLEVAERLSLIHTDDLNAIRRTLPRARQVLSGLARSLWRKQLQKAATGSVALVLLACLIFV